MVLTRRLSAILAADVVGYTRLMGADEEGTHQRLMAHRRELIDPKIEHHHGRVVKNTGDGFLAEFSSVIEAVLCAIELQSDMRKRNAEVPAEQRISFRMGVHLGDVIVEPDDIYGDGVNITARLEGLAEPDGVCISRSVHEQIRDRLPYRFEDLGHHSVKNVSRPLHVFALREGVASQPPAPGASQSPPLLTPAGSGPPRLSIVVLPFTNLNDDREQQYLADAITDDVTTDLSRIAEMSVISRTTAFTFKNKPLNTRQIGNELNVRYILEGSVRRSGQRVRVNTQLIDVERDAHIWADRFNYTTEDLLSLQDEVTAQIAVALNLELISAEVARPVPNPDALDYVLRGRYALYHSEGSTPERFEHATKMFELALLLDPKFLDARALLALTLIGRVLEQISTSAAADIARAAQAIDEVLSASPNHAQAHFAKGQMLRVQHLYEAAIPEYERAIAQNRNWAVAIAALGVCKLFAGQIEEAIPAQELAIRLSPRDPRIHNWYRRIGMVHLLLSHLDDAILWLEKARAANQRLPGAHAWLAAAYACKGESQPAAAALADARRLSLDDRYATIEHFKSVQSFGSRRTSELAETTFLAGLRLAGVPER